ERLVKGIVDSICANVQETIASNPNADIWDEGQEDVAWLDIEIDLFEDLYLLIYPDHIPLNLEDSVDVLEVSRALVQQPYIYLKYLYWYTQNGGTSKPNFFDLRDEGDANKVRAYFESLAVKFGR